MSLSVMALNYGTIAASMSDPFLVDQFRKDLITQLSENAPRLSDKQQAVALDSMINESTRTVPQLLP